MCQMCKKKKLALNAFQWCIWLSERLSATLRKNYNFLFPRKATQQRKFLKDQLCSLVLSNKYPAVN